MRTIGALHIAILPAMTHSQRDLPVVQRLSSRPLFFS